MTVAELIIKLQAHPNPGQPVNIQVNSVDGQDAVETEIVSVERYFHGVLLNIVLDSVWIEDGAVAHQQRGGAVGSSSGS